MSAYTVPCSACRMLVCLHVPETLEGTGIPPLCCSDIRSGIQIFQCAYKLGFPVRSTFAARVMYYVTRDKR